MTFDTADKKYQLNDEFAPDKESLWKYPKELDGWTHAHNSLRLEMRGLIEALEATKARGSAIKDWEAQCIKKAWKSHLDHIGSHHKNEDAIMVPFLKTRFLYPDKVGYRKMSDFSPSERHS
jgi:hemerythrin-like domain-containing protein